MRAKSCWLSRHVARFLAGKLLPPLLLRLRLRCGAAVERVRLRSVRAYVYVCVCVRVNASAALVRSESSPSGGPPAHRPPSQRSTPNEKPPNGMLIHQRTYVFRPTTRPHSHSVQIARSTHTHTNVHSNCTTNCAVSGQHAVCRRTERARPLKLAPPSPTIDRRTIAEPFSPIIPGMQDRSGRENAQHDQSNSAPQLYNPIVYV